MKRNIFWTMVLVMILAPVFPAWAQEEAEEAPEPLWDGSVGLSYLATSGNSDTMSFGLDFTAKRRPTPWGYEFFGLFSRAEDTGVLTAERYYAGAKGIRSLSEKWSLFGALTGEKDGFAGFDLRSVLSVGATYAAVNNEKVALTFDGGLTYTDEDVLVGEDNSFTGAILGLDFAWNLSKNAVLKQVLVYFPNFDESSDWRLESVTAIEASLTDLFGLRFSYDMRYRNEPLYDANGIPADDTDTTTKASLVMKF